MLALRLLGLALLGLGCHAPARDTGTAPPEPAPPAVSGLAISANQGDKTIHVLDLATGERLARFTGFDGPHEVAVSPDGRWAVVSDYGDQAVQGRALVVIDLQSLTVARTIDLGEYRRPHDLYFLPGGRQLAVTAEVNRAVLLVDFASGAVEAALDTQQRGSHMMAIAPGARRIYTANMADGSVTVLDVANRTAARVVPAVPLNEGIGLSPDGAQLWVTSLEDGTVTAYDTATWTALGTMPATGFPYRVTFTPDGRHALVPGPEEDVIRVFDVAQRAEVRRIEVPGGPGRVTVDPGGTFAVFPLHEANRVGVLDLATLEVVGTVETGGGPDGVAVSHYRR